MSLMVERYNAARRIVDEQARDPALWFDARHITEALLQKELRRLHAVIEGITSEEQARIILKSNT